MKFTLKCVVFLVAGFLEFVCSRGLDDPGECCILRDFALVIFVWLDAGLPHLLKFFGKLCPIEDFSAGAATSVVLLLLGGLFMRPDFTSAGLFMIVVPFSTFKSCRKLVDESTIFFGNAGCFWIGELIFLDTGESHA